MNIRDIIERARRAQQDNPQLHPVQLEIPEPVLWASDEERMEHFRSETFEMVAGNPGWRTDEHGRWWYSDAWL